MSILLRLCLINLCVAFAANSSEISASVLKNINLLGGGKEPDCSALAISPDESLVSAFYERRGLYIWNINSNGEQINFSHRELSRLDCRSMDIDNHGNVILGCGNEIYYASSSTNKTKPLKKLITIKGYYSAYGAIRSLKFDNNANGCYVLYQASLQQINYLEYWDINTKSKIKGIEINERVSEITFNSDKTQIAMSVYHTNNLAKNNFFTIRNAQTLEIIETVEQNSPEQMKPFYLQDKIIYLRGNRTLVGQNFEMTGEKVLDVFAKDGSMIVSTEKNYIINLPYEEEQEQTVWIWPHWSRNFSKYLSSASGNVLVSFDNTTGLNLWRLSIPSSDTSVLESAEYHNLKQPKHKASGIDYDLKSSIENGKLVITNTLNFDVKHSTIYWFILDKDGECVEKGSLNIDLDKGMEHKVQPKVNLEGKTSDVIVIVPEYIAPRYFK